MPDLKKLCTLNVGKRCEFLNTSTDCLINFIADAAGAVLRSDIKFEPRHYKKLKRFKKLLLFLARKKTSTVAKRKALLQQKGGALPALIAPLIAALAPVILGKVADAIF